MGMFTASTEISKTYTVDKNHIGEGNFAKVYKCVKKGEDTTQYAVKVIDKSKVEDMNDITREIEIMGKIDHPNVIKLIEVIDDSKKNKINLVMEMVTGGELFDRIVDEGSFTEKKAATILYTMCHALDYMHGLNIVHRDLKPENILMKSPDTSEIKIADFGLARVVSDKQMMKTACGTPGYVAPEVLQNKGYDSGAVDLWSTGVILYIMICGFPPFYEEELPALFDQIMKARYDFPSPWWDSISNGAKDCIRGLLTVDPKKRTTAAQCMANEWVTTAAPDTNIELKNLKKYNAMRKMKRATAKLVAMQRITNVLGKKPSP